MSRTNPLADLTLDEFPIAWLAEMLIAINRGDFERAAESQRQLDRFGWRVTHKRTRQFTVGYLSQEGQVSSTELEQIRRSCDELSKEILASSELPKLLKTWLLDLARAMRHAIDRFQVQGTRGLRHQLQEALRSFVLNEQHPKAVRKESPTIWMRLLAGVERVEKVSRLVEHVMKITAITMKAIDYFSGINSPSPPSK